jgi:hypothetical protein
VLALTQEGEPAGIKLGEYIFMHQANSSADQLAKTVFWIVMFSTATFVIAVLILIR